MSTATKRENNNQSNSQPVQSTLASSDSNTILLSNPKQTPTKLKQGSKEITSNNAHLNLTGLLYPEDFALIEELCPERIYDSLIHDIEGKEKAMSEKINSIQDSIRKIFSDLMDADCLNAQKPDQFLTMKNKIQIKIVDDGASDPEFTQQLKEAFADLGGSGTTPESNLSSVQRNELGRQMPQQYNRKRLSNAGNLKGLESSSSRKIQSISQQLQSVKDVKLRNEILAKIEREALPCNRLQHEFSEDEVNSILAYRRDFLSSKCNPHKMQLHPPSTQGHSKILQNTYLSELDIDGISERLDLELANNLGQCQPDKPDGQSFMNVNCAYNFRPTNFNFLMLSRFSFAMKKKRIQKYMRKRIEKRRTSLKASLQRLEEQELIAEGASRIESMRDLAALEIAYPKLYKEKIASRLKHWQVLEQQGFDLGKSGPSQHTFTPRNFHHAHLGIRGANPAGSLASAALNQENSMSAGATTVNAVGGVGLGALAAEIPDDVLRAKTYYCPIPQNRYNIYSAPEPSHVQVSHSFKLIEDPVDYEMEYKKRNVWSLKDMRIFLIALLKGPKRFDKIGQVLPHKTAREIIFFFHTFKKLLKLKNEIKNARELMKMKINQPNDITYSKQADMILEPLICHIKKNKIDIVSNASSYNGTITIGGSAQSNSTPQMVHVHGQSHVRHQKQVQERRMQQTQFNVDELLQIFASAYNNLGNGTRRRPKVSSYATLQDSLISQHPSSQGLYQLKTFKVRPEFLGCPSTNHDPQPDVISHFKAQQIAEQEGLGLTPSANNLQNLANLNELRKVDYLEQVEKEGREVIDFMLQQQDKINETTSKLRQSLSTNQSQYSLLKNDNWRQVNYAAPPQWMLAYNLQKEIDQQQSMPKKKPETLSGLARAKCLAQARQMDQRVVFEFKFPAQSKQSKRGRSSQGFTFMQFADMGEKAKYSMHRFRLIEQQRRQLLLEALVENEDECLLCIVNTLFANQPHLCSYRRGEFQDEGFPAEWR